MIPHCWSLVSALLLVPLHHWSVLQLLGGLQRGLMRNCAYALNLTLRRCCCRMFILSVRLNVTMTNDKNLSFHYKQTSHFLNLSYHIAVKDGINVPSPTCCMSQIFHVMLGSWYRGQLSVSWQVFQVEPTGKRSQETQETLEGSYIR